MTVENVINLFAKDDLNKIQIIIDNKQDIATFITSCFGTGIQYDISLHELSNRLNSILTYYITEKAESFGIDNDIEHEKLIIYNINKVYEHIYYTEVTGFDIDNDSTFNIHIKY